MSEFKPLSICILGRQSQLGLAELESVYGAGHIMPLPGAALLDIPAEDINFKRLGGTIKVARLLATLDSAGWTSLAKYLTDKIPEHIQYLPDGKFTLGLSVYGVDVPIKRLAATLLELKKLIRLTGRPVRIVPNKELALNSAQVLHNKLTYKGAWELMYVKASTDKTYLAQTLFVQDIEAYAARDQARPHRDSRVGMLPPKLAQIILNLAVGQPSQNQEDKSKIMVLDPFCGTGVILQEALLADYSVMGTDIEPKMVDYTTRNLKWLLAQQPLIEGSITVEEGDATNHRWANFDSVASEIFLGRPLNSLPDPSKLKEIISDVDVITKKFLKNLAPQLKSGSTLCLAVPTWRKPDGKFINLPVIDHLTDIGYNYSSFKHVDAQRLVYFREDQVVARKLIKLVKG